MAEAQPIHNEPLPGFDGVYGLELLAVDPSEVRARLDVTPGHLQAGGIVHGGVYASMAESMASLGAYVAAGEGKWVAGTSNSTTFLRLVRSGIIEAVARPLHVGRTMAVWDVSVTDSEGRTVAVSRVSIAVRDAR